MPDAETLARAQIVVGNDVSDAVCDRVAAISGRPVVRGVAAAEAPLVYVGHDPPEPVERFCWVHASAAGVDSLLARDAPWPAQTLITRTVGAMGQRMAEYVLAWMLAHHQHVRLYARDQDVRRWDPRLPTSLAGREVLVVGAGEIGTTIATALRAAGTRVHGLARSSGARGPFETVVRSVDELPDPRRIDWVVGALPLTGDTRAFFGARFFSSLRRAGFVNIGRGATVDDAALLRALEGGQLTTAVLDVFEDEPLPADSPLWTAPGVAVTPHVSGPTLDSDVIEEFAAAWRALAAGELPERAVDPKRGY